MRSTRCMWADKTERASYFPISTTHWSPILALSILRAPRIVDSIAKELDTCRPLSINAPASPFNAVSYRSVIMACSNSGLSCDTKKESDEVYIIHTAIEVNWCYRALLIAGIITKFCFFFILKRIYESNKYKGIYDPTTICAILLIARDNIW